MTDNELIAEFMGAKQDQVHAPIGEYMWYDKTHFGIYLYHKNKLLYNTSWDWLMPVVQKIYKLYDEFNFTSIAQENMFINVLNNPVKYPIHIIYNDVVEFIKWYNQNK